MHGNTVLLRLVRALAVGLMLLASGLSLLGSEANVTRTNWFDRWITNVIEVRMPANRFVNEYHTNWVTLLRTNVVDVYATNRVTRTLTNQVVVDAFRTNLVAAYHTNWNLRSLTNVVVVQATRTNVVVACQTNWNVKTLTNQVTGGSAGPLTIEAAKTARPVVNNLVEVQLKARWSGMTTAPLQFQSWRVEREDGAVLLFGQDQTFKRQLPVGKYKVQAQLRAEGDNLPLVARGTLSVTAQEVTIQQKLLVKK
jgi:hypothetical protein